MLKYLRCLRTLFTSFPKSLNSKKVKGGPGYAKVPSDCSHGMIMDTHRKKNCSI